MGVRVSPRAPFFFFLIIVLSHAESFSFLLSEFAMLANMAPYRMIRRVYPSSTIFFLIIVLSHAESFSFLFSEFAMLVNMAPYRMIRRVYPRPPSDARDASYGWQAILFIFCILIHPPQSLSLFLQLGVRHVSQHGAVSNDTASLPHDFTPNYTHHTFFLFFYCAVSLLRKFAMFSSMYRQNFSATLRTNQYLSVPIRTSSPPPCHGKVV